jgi:uncharacterized membrane protein
MLTSPHRSGSIRHEMLQILSMLLCGAGLWLYAVAEDESSALKVLCIIGSFIAATFSVAYNERRSPHDGNLSQRKDEYRQSIIINVLLGLLGTPLLRFLTANSPHQPALSLLFLWILCGSNLLVWSYQLLQLSRKDATSEDAEYLDS